MWGTVLLMAAVAGVDPARIAAVVFILSRTKPMRLLLAYFVGGFGLSLIIGAVVVFVLKGAGVGQKSSVPPEIEIAVGVLALVAAALIGSGVAARLRDRAQARRPKDKVAVTHGPPDPGTRPGIEQLPGFDRLPPRAQAALKSESPWVAWVAGLAVGMPTAYYLAAIAAILNSGGGAGPQVAALVVFNLIAFALAEIPMVSFLIAPEATRARVDQLYDWMNTHHRVIVTALAAVVGVYLIVVGISKL
jgi:Sap, sulfolipid-1-addressing protein